MKKLSFLLVDDNSWALKELQDALKYFGYRTIEETSRADEAWRMLRFRRYDCIIAEMEMPGMSGLELLKKTREDDRFYNIPFFLTNSAFTKVKVVIAGREGATGLIVKPFDVQNFRQKMEMLKVEPADAPDLVETRQALEEGLKLIERNDHAGALTVFEKMVEAGESAEVYYNIGYIKTSQGQYGEAIAAFRKATQLDRLFAKAYEAMGRAYQKLGRKQDAEKALQKAADIYMTKEKMQDAEEILTEIMEINPDTVNVYNSLGVLYRKKGDYLTALKHYQKALKIHPDTPHIYYNMGRLHLDLNDPGKAKRFFADAVKLDPGFKEAREVLDAIELGEF
ncbi:MAG: tetratricopeptide repeat protein [Desulfobacterales bacterium]|jgi:tetratricopeptide (TPR) repeat protein|nr:tetratricopeptide repeat protein [Desulfobacterales bacterium]